MIEKLKKIKISLTFMMLGGVAGFLYWRFVGCASGTCPITSRWYASTLYGMMLGYLIGDLISSFFKKKQNP